jgi:magnesium transporter
MEVDMISFTTFYLSRILGRKVYDVNGKFIGIVKDILVDVNHASQKPIVIGLKIKSSSKTAVYSVSYFRVNKFEGRITVTCINMIELSENIVESGILLADVILDKQIVDLNGRKLVRVNDIRLVQFKEGTFAVAVDIGVEGLLRRIGIAKVLKYIFGIFKIPIPAKYILWEDVEAVDYNNLNIKLSKSYTKLHTLHPSDIADIIEDLDKKSRTEVFSSLDEEKAAEVLEELEPEFQAHIVESLPVEKVADVLEKMPADEVADLLDTLEDEKAELLLNEMETDSSQDVRELLEYPLNTVGSIMMKEVYTYKSTNTVEEVLADIRANKPDFSELYNLFVTDDNNELIATFTLCDLVLSPVDARIESIMKPTPVQLMDNEKLDDVAEMLSKYNLLAIPVIDDENVLHGMVIVDDIVDDLINRRRTNK